jgi:CBS domain-containing protein
VATARDGDEAESAEAHAHIVCNESALCATARRLQPRNAMMIAAKDLMTSPVVTFFAEQTLPLAEDVMQFKHLRHLPVVDDSGRLVGLVSHRDLLRANISSLTGLTAEQRRARQDEVRVEQIMTRDVWTVTPETEAWVVGKTLLDHRFGCLPVVDRDHRLVGIVTERDFIKYAIDRLE